MGQVLVADDEPKLGRVVAEMLTLDGHHVRRVSGGRQALTELQQSGADVVITDLKMPEVDGMAVLAEALRLVPAPAVIVMTGHATTQSAVEAMKAGAADYLTKPFAMDELRLRVRRLCDQRLAVQRSEQDIRNTMSDLEKTITRLNNERHTLDAKLAEPTDDDELQRLCDRLAEVADELDTAEQKWAKLQEELDVAG